MRRGPQSSSSHSGVSGQDTTFQAHSLPCAMQSPVGPDRVTPSGHITWVPSSGMVPQSQGWQPSVGNTGGVSLLVSFGGLQPAMRIAVRDNLGWARSPTERGVRFGYSADNDDITLTANGNPVPLSFTELGHLHASGGALFRANLSDLLEPSSE